MDTIELFDAAQLNKINWPINNLGRLGKQLLVPFLQLGVANFIENVQTELLLLKLDDLILPITINEKEYENSYVASNYCWVSICQEAMRREHSPLFNWLLSPLLQAEKFLLKWAKVNKVILINNWLLTANLYPSLSPEQLHRMVVFLTRKYPCHTLMFRSLNQSHNLALIQALKEEGCRLVHKHDIYLYKYPDQDLPGRIKYRQKRDARLLLKQGYEVLEHEQIDVHHIPRLLELYRLLYVQKHTSYSPLFTPVFLEHLLKTKTIEIKALSKSGKLDGMIAFIKTDQVMTIPFCGYDTTLPTAVGLYPMINSLAVSEVKKTGLSLDHGSGAEEFKQMRGLIGCPEYIFVYDKHLSLARRSIWALSEKMNF